MEPRGRADGATFTDNVTYRETGGKSAVKRTVTSRRCRRRSNGGLGEIREARFDGSVRLRDENGGAAANADQIRYQVTTGQMELTGTSAGMPHVVNDQMVVDARAWRWPSKDRSCARSGVERVRCVP